MTEVSGYMIRPRNFSMFLDITGPGVAVEFQKVPDSTDTCVVFDAHLTAEQTVAVWERMTSRDDVDQAKRAALRVLLDYAAACIDEHADTAHPLVACTAVLVHDLAAYELGAPPPVPEPVTDPGAPT